MSVTVIQRNGFKQLTRDAVSQELPWEQSLTAADLIPSGYEKALVIRGGEPLSPSASICDGDHINVIGLPSGWVAVGIGALIGIGVTIKHYADKYGQEQTSNFGNKQSDHYGWSGISTRRGQGFGMPLIYGTTRIGGIVGGGKVLAFGTNSVALYYLNLLGEGPFRKVGQITDNTEGTDVDTLLLDDLPLASYAATARVSMGADVPVHPGTTDPFYTANFGTTFSTTVDVGMIMDMKFTIVPGLRFWDVNFGSDQGNFPPYPDGSGLDWGSSQNQFPFDKFASARQFSGGFNYFPGEERDNKYIYWILDDKSDSGTSRPGRLVDTVGTHTGNFATTSGYQNATRWKVVTPGSFAVDDLVSITGQFQGKNHEFGVSNRQHWSTEVRTSECFTQTVDFYNFNSAGNHSRKKYGPYEFELEEASGVGTPTNRVASTSPMLGWTKFKVKELQGANFMFVVPYPGADPDDTQKYWSYYGSVGSTTGGWKGGTYDGSHKTLINAPGWIATGGASNTATISGVWGDPGTIETAGADRSNITGGVPAMFIYKSVWATWSAPQGAILDKVIFNLEFSGGLYRLDTSGATVAHSQTFEIQYSRHDNTDGWQTLGYFMIRGKYTGAMWQTITIHPTTGTYNGSFYYMDNYDTSGSGNITMEMQSSAFWDSNGNIPGSSVSGADYSNRMFAASTVFSSAIGSADFRVCAVGRPDNYPTEYTTNPDSGAPGACTSSCHLSSVTFEDRTYAGGGLGVMPGTAWVELSDIVNYTANSQVPELTVVVDGNDVKQYSNTGTASTIHADSADFRNPAWITLNLLLSEVYGGGNYVNDDTDVDWQSFLDWAEFCGVDSAAGAMDPDKQSETYIHGSPYGVCYQIDLTTYAPNSALRISNTDPTFGDAGFWIALNPGDKVHLDPDALSGAEGVPITVTVQSMQVDSGGGVLVTEEDLSDVGTYPGITLLQTMAFNVVIIGPRCEFNGAFDEDSSLFEAIDKVLSVGRATLVREGTRFRAVTDMTRSVSQVFTESAIRQGSMSVNEVSTVDVPTEIEIQYLEKKYNYDRETVRMTLPGFESATFSNERKISNDFVVGITGRAAAESYAYYQLLKLQYRRKTLQMEVSLEGLAAQVGDRIQIQHRDLIESVPFNIAGWGAYEPLDNADYEDQTAVVPDRDIAFSDDLQILVVVTGVGDHEEYTPNVGQGWTSPAGQPFPITEVVSDDYTGNPAFLATPAWSESDWIVESIETTKDGFRKISASQYDERIYDDGAATAQLSSLGSPGGPPLGGAAAAGWDVTAQANSITLPQGATGSGFEEKTMATALDVGTPAAPVITVPGAFTTAVGTLPAGETLILDSFVEANPSAIGNSSSYYTNDKITAPAWFVDRLVAGSAVQIYDSDDAYTPESGVFRKKQLLKVKSFENDLGSENRVFLVEPPLSGTYATDAYTILSILNYRGTNQTVTVASVDTNDITLSAALSQVPQVDFSVSRGVFHPTSFQGMAPSGLSGTRVMKQMPDGTIRWGISLTWNPPSVDPLTLPDSLAVGMAGGPNSVTPWLTSGSRSADARLNGYLVWNMVQSVDEGGGPSEAWIKNDASDLFEGFAEDDISSRWTSLGRVEEEEFTFWEAEPNHLYTFAISPISVSGAVYQPDQAPQVAVTFTLYDAKRHFLTQTVPPKYPCPTSEDSLSFDGTYASLRFPPEFQGSTYGVPDGEEVPPTLYSSSVVREEGAIPDYYDVRLQGITGTSWGLALKVSRTRDESTIISQLGPDEAQVFFKPVFKSGQTSSQPCILVWPGYEVGGNPNWTSSIMLNSQRDASWPGVKNALVVPAGETYLQVSSTIAAAEDYVTTVLDAGVVGVDESRLILCIPSVDVLDEGTIFDGNTTKFSEPAALNRMWEGSCYERYAEVQTYYSTSSDDVTYTDDVRFYGSFQSNKRYYKIKCVIKRFTPDATVRIEEVATRILSSA